MLQAQPFELSAILPSILIDRQTLRKLLKATQAVKGRVRGGGLPPLTQSGKQPAATLFHFMEYSYSNWDPSKPKFYLLHGSGSEMPDTLMCACGGHRSRTVWDLRG